MSIQVITQPSDAKHDFPVAQARKVFQDVQLGEDELGSTEVGGGSDSMIYAEFLESLGAIAVYKNSNPYISLRDKLETFLTDAHSGFITCLNTAIKKDKKKLKLATSAASATNKAYASHGGRAAMAVIKPPTPRTPGRTDKSARGTKKTPRGDSRDGARRKSMVNRDDDLDDDDTTRVKYKGEIEGSVTKVDAADFDRFDLNTMR